jgi:ABC-type transport system substrate-binding protein
MNLIVRRISAFALGAVGFACADPITAGAQSKPVDEPVALEIAYAMSFVDYDACGDAEAGRALRHAILAKLQACPYSPAAREMFQDVVRLNVDQLLSETLGRQVSKDTATVLPPELKAGHRNPDGTPMTCSDYRSTPRYLERRANLLRYAHGEIGASQALDEQDCPSGPASL